MDFPMIEIVPQTKKIFAKEALALMHELKNKILELDVRLPSFHQQLDGIISTIKLVQDAAIKADFYIPNSPFAEIIHNLEASINLLCDRRTEIDWVAKELLIEVINMSNQVINEYCLEMDLSKDWIEIQSNLFAQINEHLQLATDETISRKNLNLYDIADEPFNLEDTPEALHLFDMNFELSKLEDCIAPIESLDNSDGFLMIQIDQEQDDWDSSKLFQDIADNAHDELTTLFPSLTDSFTGDFDEFTESLQESDKTNNGEILPMPELFAEIFSATVNEQSLENNNQTEIKSVKWNEKKLDIEDTAETEDVWTKFTAMESWVQPNDEELVPAFDLSDFDLPNNDISEDMTPNNFFESSDSSTASLDSEDYLHPKTSTSPSDIDSSTMLAEMLKEDFPTSDIDTAIEESPIYQNNAEDISSSWHDLSLMNFGDTEISYADFAALSPDTKTDIDLDMSSHNNSQGDIQLDTKGNDATIRIPLNHLEMLGDLSEELLVRKGSLDIYLAEIKTLSSQAQNHLQSLEYNADSRQSQTAITGLQNAVDQIVNMLSLTEQQTYAMSQDVNHLRRNLKQLLKHPISSLVTRFPRILRDLSPQYGKQVELVVQGAGVEVERLISETIAKPLEILLRNAFKHGIESPHDRQLQGKAPQGKIEFIATQTDESTIIKVSDDGCGIDIEKIRHQVEQSAAIAGMSGFSTMDMSDEQLINLIFEPSFNLAPNNSETGTKLSDVKKKLRELGGNISVKSQKGKGTQFTLVLPNVNSVIRVLLIDVNQMCLAIPSKMILEVVHSNSPILDSEEKETLLWRDRILPVIRLNSLLKLNCRHSLSQSSLQSSNQSLQSTNSPESQKPSQAIPSLLVIHYENDLFALQTDGCWHDQEATFHQIEGNISLPHIFLGTVVLGSNQAVALLNPAELVSQCLRSDAHVSGSQEMYSNFENLSSLSDFFSAGDTPSFSSASADSNSARDLVRSPEPENLESSGLFTNELVKPPVKPQQPRVLIVESSANVRRYLAMMLTKSGFLTEQVQDGKEAIAFLKNCLEIKTKVDVVITDLEMPHMDGFKLLSSVLVDDDLQNLPIIVLTEKNNENDRKLALDLGAKAYLCKPYREQELVEKLHQVISG
ncbi:response regulator [Pseudanabaena sp. UWO311]|uniref:ATP-binding response regulator n=2 Tax=Pseudanabaena sp. UWO311 TaxID=2487337 RepID=UPI00115C2CD9|nr:response regulator [Pseudanabaena sp. UWO311]TYQ25119.1 response regulator [Pseudanabaena sp. UWO311]